MKGPEGEKYDQKKEKDPLEVASYDKAEGLFSAGHPTGIQKGTRCSRQTTRNVKKMLQSLAICPYSGSGFGGTMV